MSSFGASIDQKPVARFARLWESASAPPDIFSFLSELPPLASDDLVEVCEIDLLLRWGHGIALPVERYLELRADLPGDHPFRQKLVLAEWKQMAEHGVEPDLTEWVERFPQLREVLQKEHAAIKAIVRNDGLTGPKNVGPTVIVPGEPIPSRSPDVSKEQSRASESKELAENPETIGRYRVLRVLGDGGFGRVYLSHDDVLDRQVAIKTPHRSRVKSPKDIDAYLIEARILAKLDHRNIVPVHDCGQTEDGLCFVVSKYIEGCDLSTKLKRTPLTFAAIAELVSQIADALHYAHLRRIIHRDVKPANILIDLEDQPHLVDFGIALKEEDFGKLQPTMGTVPYMSPEQLRGEGHLVDGRSDIFSLGVMFYEMLTGRRPFRPNRLSQDLAIEARPPRQIDDSIPKELERICLKSLSPRVVDRYNTALDMATDLREFLRIKETTVPKPVVVSDSGGSEVKATSGHLAAAQWTPIIPKGLRSFDRDDANFFLELLPGPRNREGVPDSVQFWVNRISQMDPEQTFRVGLIYGPSGCGKSSFMKAGVLPRLPQTITALYVECTPFDTEARLLKSLRRSCPDLSHDLDLVGSLAAIRKGQILANGRKLLIVLDQFEQWLHERAAEQGGELVRALRQCDGERLQCILGVRDDFWMAVTHFMDELEVPFVRGENVTAVDLFSTRHARKVLIAIGQAYETLPANYEDLQPDQKDFITESIAELAENDRIVPVQLALFAEMVKDQPWNLATLKNFGGIAGVGVTFLEETFNGRTASPNHRLHQRAARNVLKALLSDQSREIKGAMRSHQELLAVSGYEEHPREFETLLRILDADLRLITPTDPEGSETGEVRSDSGSGNRERFYHLTHDYLVPSLRDWLTRKQKETRRGRAELSLADHAGNWAARPTARSLPSFLEWVNILAFVPRRVMNGNPTQRILLTKATGYYSRRILFSVAMLGLLIWGFREQSYRSEAAALVNSLRTSSTRDVPRIVKQLEPYRSRAQPLLLKLVNSPESTEALHAAMSLPLDKNTEEILVSGLLTAESHSFSAIRAALLKGGKPPGLEERLWKELQTVESSPTRRFAAGVALVYVDPPTGDPPPQRWQQQFKFLADQLVLEIKSNPGSFDSWVEALQPIRKNLFNPLRETFLGNNQIDRSEAANILGVFARDEPQILTELVLSADPDQYGKLSPRLKALGRPAQDSLTAVFNSPLPTDGKIEARILARKRTAYAAVALLEFDQLEPIVSVFSSLDDRDLVSHAEDRLSRLAAHPETLHKLLNRSETRIRASILRSLSGMKWEQIVPERLHEPLLTAVTRLFREDPNGGVHSAAELTLSSWSQGDQVRSWKKDSAPRDPAGERGWYVTKSGETMIVFRGPIVTTTGSPVDELAHEGDEAQRKRIINRDFAIASKEVTHADFLMLTPGFRHKENAAIPTPLCAASSMSWHRAAEYCNALSTREGIPENELCYEIDPQGFAKPFPDHLQRAGYRLPTEVEWEFSCRAGTPTAFYWGNDPLLAERYAWTITNSQSQNHPVGQLVPNNFGLHDMLGNVMEWTGNVFDELKPVLRELDVEDPEVFDRDNQRITRGGSAIMSAARLRIANRTPGKAYTGVSLHLGFRVARTLKKDTDGR